MVLTAADDANYGILTRFVMDTPMNMSAGTLYAAKFTQIDDETVAVGRDADWTALGGQFDVEWIELGHSTQDEIVALAETTTFEDIFEVEDPDEDDECKP